MLNAGVLSFDGTGRIRTRNAAPPTDFNGGTPTVTIAGPVNLLCGNNVAADVYAQGAGYTSAGILSASDVGAVASHSQGGLPLNAGGQVMLDPLGAIVSYNAGLPYNAAGKLAIAVPE